MRKVINIYYRLLFLIIALILVSTLKIYAEDSILKKYIGVNPNEYEIISYRDTLSEDSIYSDLYDFFKGLPVNVHVIKGFTIPSKEINLVGTLKYKTDITNILLYEIIFINDSVCLGEPLDTLQHNYLPGLNQKCSLVVVNDPPTFDFMGLMEKIQSKYLCSTYKIKAYCLDYVALTDNNIWIRDDEPSRLTWFIQRYFNFYSEKQKRIVPVLFGEMYDAHTGSRGQMVRVGETD